MFRKAILKGILQQSFNSESRDEISSNFLQEEEAKNKVKDDGKANIEKDEEEKLSVSKNWSFEVGIVQNHIKDENKEIEENKKEIEKLWKKERYNEHNISPVSNHIKKEKEEIGEDKKDIVKLLKEEICEEHDISYVNKTNCSDKELDDLIATLKSKKEKTLDEKKLLHKLHARRRSRKSWSKKIANMTEEQNEARKEILRKRQQTTRAKANYSIRDVKDYVNETNCSDKKLDDHIATLKSKKQKTLDEQKLLHKLLARRRSRKSWYKKIANMTEEQINARKEILRKKQQTTREKETQEQKELRKRKNRERRKQVYQKLTEEEKRQKSHFNYCDLCDFKALQWGNLREHIEDVHKNVVFACDQCVRTFSRKSYLRNHISFAHENRKFLCDQCDKKYSTKSMLKKHIESIHKKVYYFCDKCGHKAKTSGDLKIHNDSVQCRVNMIIKQREIET